MAIYNEHSQATMELAKLQAANAEVESLIKDLETQLNWKQAGFLHAKEELAQQKAACDELEAKKTRNQERAAEMVTKLDAEIEDLSEQIAFHQVTLTRVSLLSSKGQRHDE